MCVLTDVCLILDKKCVDFHADCIYLSSFSFDVANKCLINSS